MGLEGTSMVASEPRVSERITVAVEELDHVIRDLRNYIFGLRPGILADRELDTAVRALVEEFRAKTGVVTIVEIDPEIAAQLASVASDVVQLTREALSNVGRHARATTCRVSLRHEAGAALLEIDDDGSGSEPSMVRRGLGLANLEGACHGHGREGVRDLGSRPRNDGPDRAAAVGAYCTISAVTIPYIPCGPSTCGRMWQWYAQTPGYSAFTRMSKR